MATTGIDDTVLIYSVMVTGIDDTVLIYSVMCHGNNRYR